MLRRSTPCGTALMAASTEAFSGNVGSGVDAEGAGAGVSSSAPVLSGAGEGGGDDSVASGAGSGSGLSAAGVAPPHAIKRTANPNTGYEMRDTAMSGVYPRLPSPA